ncbi:hypothetical protein NQ315_011848 [Exocentrus adspersus]|uniref:Rab-GAP TBC domain-containing protein n=1 Tax=Exocentrus adspersus TaxID=1586481 RepID=A0AAV8W1R7_9CUCU|nr:hypothetical protein NQ315_011848 [Exocentrus adspersus]
MYCPPVKRTYVLALCIQVFGIDQTYPLCVKKKLGLGVGDSSLFLTLFCNCLPQPTVLRVWDLILLEGNEILLRTALAIWQVLAERILGVRSADEFYCIMGVLTRELLEFDLVDGNSLIKAMVTIGPLTELKSLREHYLYNINPWGPSLPQAVVEKQLKLYSRQSIALDISALKKQYAKLKQRQRQAHIIFSAAISRQPPPAAPVTMNHLLLGKSALVPAKRLGPPKGSIPPARQLPPSTLLWKDAPKQSSSSSSSDTELCDDDDDDASGEDIDDNPVLPPDSDSSNILMSTDDNTISAKAKTSASETDRVVEVDAGRATSPAPTEIKSDTCESDDESFDFERFLEDRVRHLKVDDATTEDEPEVRINYTRRNSSKALQIIQENSLILHRILQCQARMTPSPSPPTVTDESKPISDLPSPEISTGTYPDFLTQLLLDSSTATELKSPEYGSRYTSILEKSKSLDEKYNALILNTPPLKQSMSEQKSITSICEEKLQTSQASSYFVDSVLYEGKVYEAASPEKCSIASSFTKKYRLSPEENESNNLPELEDASSSETYNLVGKLETSPTSTTIEYTFPTTDYGNYSYKFPSDSSKEEQTGDTLTSFRWNDTPEQAVSPYSNNDDTDSGVISILESNSSEYPKTETVTNDSKSTPVENGHGATTTLYDYSFPTLTLEEDSSHSSYYKDLVSRLSNYPLSSEEDEVTTNSKETSPLQNLTLASPSEPDSSRKKSLTLSTSPHGESSRSRSPSKSPSKVFNPFPVPLSSRQSKEVPLKLGLYKK